jgi:type 1 glutamine amidotransferase
MKTRVLVVCVDPWHRPETIRRGLAPLKDFDFEFLKAGANCPADLSPEFSVVVLAKANMISASDQRAWLTPESERAFQNHLRRGHGLLVIHGGTSRYGELPAMRRAMGGAFLRHPPECPVTLEPNVSHALARDVNHFTVRDEHYLMAYEGSEADVFLRSRSEHGVQPAGWTRRVDGGRICVLTPGHRLEVWLHPEFQKILANALRWTAKLD